MRSSTPPRIAWRAELIARELGPGKLLGILLDRSPDLIVALLAVLKAGSAYIPLDPNYPAERLGFIIENSRLPAVISRSTLCGRIDGQATSFVLVDEDAAAIQRHSGEALDTIAAPNDLAYVIYTSGSTGWPKGVQIEHRALVNLLCAMAVAPGILPAMCWSPSRRSHSTSPRSKCSSRLSPARGW